MKIRLFLLTCILIFSSNLNAGSLEENFNNAVQAYNVGNFDQAGDLFFEVGNQLRKKDLSKATQAWNNAAVAKKKAQNYEGAEKILQHILEVNKKLPLSQQITILSDLGFNQGMLHKNALQIKTFERLIKVGDKKLDPNLKTNAYVSIADAYRRLELYSSAASFYELALNSLSKEFDPKLRAKYHTALGLCQERLGNYQDAEINLERARNICETLNDLETLAYSNSNLGIMYRDQGNYEKAEQFINQAIEIENKAKLEQQLGADKNNLGLIKRITGNYPEALRLFNESLEIAKNINNIKDQGIAIVNKALLYRIVGQYEEAERNYSLALNLFNECNFQEGVAGAHLGIGRMVHLKERNYVKALDEYNMALATYRELNLVREEEQTLEMLGELYKAIALPTTSSTRDLSFDEEDDTPKIPSITKKESLEKSKQYWKLALDICENLGLKGVAWAPEQGLGFVDYCIGNYEDAFEHYQKAINIVTATYTCAEDVQMLGEYMTGKEDLYQEAMSVCSALYNKSNDQKYLELILKYQETLKNEVQKASSALVTIKFEDPRKEELFNKLQMLGRKQAQAIKSIPNTIKNKYVKVANQELLSKDKSNNKLNISNVFINAELKAESELRSKGVLEQSVIVNNITQDYEKVLNEWKNNYPNDINIFDSAARVDIKKIQDNISNDQAVLQYILLQEQLIINVIQKDKIFNYIVSISRRDLENIIKKEFLINYIEKGYGRNNYSYSFTEIVNSFNEVNLILHKLYKYLVEPVKEIISDNKRLYIICDGYLACCPFGGLVSNIDENNIPTYLIENYEIGYLRPAFIENIYNKNSSKRVKKILAIANADNKNYPMKLLHNTILEVINVEEEIDTSSELVDIAIKDKFYKPNERNYVESIENAKKKYEYLKSKLNYIPDDPNEFWLRDKLKNNNYEMLYFATHGMPYSDCATSLNDINKVESKLKAKGMELSEQRLRIKKLSELNLRTSSPYNGFLYLSSLPDDDILITDQIPEERDGLFTIKEIMQLDDESLKNTQYVILSACNTAVTFVPKTLSESVDKDEEDVQLYNSKEIEKNLRDQGWIPGVDQIGFVDVFMRKHVKNVYGTFWFADDRASAEIMTEFIKNMVNQQEHPDAIASITYAQRALINQSKNKGNKLESVLDNYGYPIHPYYWALAAMFGK